MAGGVYSWNQGIINMAKIINLKQLGSIKRNTSKLVLCGGCFDIFHIGHLRFLQTAKKSGDILMVLLEPDEKVKKLKGQNRPIHTQRERAQILSNISLIDYVVTLPDLKSDSDYYKLIKKIKPDIIAVTKNDIILKKKKIQAKKVGAGLLVINLINTPSTTQRIKLLGID